MGVRFMSSPWRPIWFTCYERSGGLWPFRKLRCSCATLSDGCLSPPLPRMDRNSVGKQQRSLLRTRGSTGIGSPVISATRSSMIGFGLSGVVERLRKWFR